MKPDTIDAFVAAGVLTAQDVVLARHWGRALGEQRADVLLGAAFSLRALRAASVCVDVHTVAETRFAADEEAVDSAALPWPDPDAWSAALESSPLVAVGTRAPARPLRLVDGLLYLDRYWGHEERVRTRLEDLLLDTGAPPDGLDATLDQFFTGAGLAEGEPDLQRRAAARVSRAGLTILVGGPGTGKTSTVARLLATQLSLADSEGRRAPSIALAAPTGKAAVRLSESLRSEVARLPERFTALGQLNATTVHRLLGSRGLSSVRFTHGPGNPLPYDLVVVDEASMVSLAMMRRLLDALRPDTRLVLVGDPDQLTSVEAGAVLADVVQAPGLQDAAVALTHNWRFGAQIADLAAAIRDGRADDVVEQLASAEPDGAVQFVALDPAAATPDQLAALRRRVVDSGLAVATAARRGDTAGAVAALDRHRLLCAHRSGSYGVSRWSWEAQRWLAEDVPELGQQEAWTVGQPLLVNRNQPEIGIYNGDAGVVVATEAGPRAGFVRGDGVVELSQAQLSDYSPLFAMTVHKSQGSQFGHVTVVLPPPESPLLSRELLYTAVTRARHAVTILGTPESVRAAVERPVVRASGLRQRLGVAG